MESYHTAIDKYDGSYKDIFKDYPIISPEDNAAIMFTSGEYAAWSSIHDVFLTTIRRYDWIAKGCIEHPASVPYEYTQRMFSNLSPSSPSHSMCRQSSVDGEHCLGEEEVFQTQRPWLKRRKKELSFRFLCSTFPERLVIVYSSLSRALVSSHRMQMLATMSGMKIVLMTKWIPEEG